MSGSARALGFVLLMGAVLAPPAATDACAPAPPRNVVVEIASESAVIVWDAKTKTQHFIRRAAFRATANEGAKGDDFGFLVPTPTQPVLAEVDDKAFDELARVTAPKTETVKRGGDGGGCRLGCGFSGSAPGGARPVEVLDEKHVAGYDAKVLRANDPDALTAWLTERGYEVRPALTRWLKPYVEKGWIVTAFKVSRAPGAPASYAVGTSAVRMSFVTDAPFFPYSEPDDMRDSKTKRLLRVFVLADARMAGKLGAGEWPGKVAWAGKLPADAVAALPPLLKVPGYAPTAETWLTEFEDAASPRPGTADVTFAVDDNQRPVERPSRIVYAARPDPAGRAGFVVFAAALAAAYLLMRRYW